MIGASWILIEFAVVAAFGVTAFGYYIRRTVKCVSQRTLPGRVAIVTGASSGIGFEIACGLAHRRLRVILACRNVQRAQEAAKKIRQTTGWNDVVIRQLDLCSFKSVRNFAEEILEEESRLDVLINNAAIVPKKPELTEDGLDVQFQTNYLGPFLLTRLLMPILEKTAPSRVVNLSSYLYRMGRLQVDSDDFGRAPQHRLVTYAASKLALVIFTRELARRSKRVLVVSCTPGTSNTNIARDVPWILRNTVGRIAANFFRTAEQGAQTPLHLAVDEHLEQVWPTGQYFVDCAPEPLASVATPTDEVAQRLWDMSEKLTAL
ncbi:retinol dehydrogenase 14-like [Ornithodoros turicata]|uniref:retinol dehydrogenase 14-like n=1 Tax=Ornithodoros turicata TaxID=34597 RepID=UPI00313902E7